MALYVAQSTVFDYPMHFSGERSNSGTIISRGVSVRTIICDMKQPKLNRAVVETHRLRTTKVRSLLHLNRHNVALSLISIHPLDWDRKCGEIITCPQICQSILIDKSDWPEIGRNHFIVMIDSIALIFISAMDYEFRAAAFRYCAPHTYESEFELKIRG